LQANEKEEIQEERQAQIGAEIRAFAFSDLTASDVHCGNEAPPMPKKGHTEEEGRTKAVSESCYMETSSVRY
jgi:hypothetical protein